MIKQVGRAAGVVVVALGVLVVPTAPGAAAVPAYTGTGCRVTSYVPDGGHLTGWTAEPTITIADQITIGAHTTTSVLVEQNPATEVTASARLGSTLATSGPALWSAVEARAGRRVARQGERTGPSSAPWRDAITHSSAQNRTFVHFRGVTLYTGHYQRDLCITRSGSDVGTVARATAPLRTFSRATVQGRTQCGTTPRSPWEKAAQRYCR